MYIYIYISRYIKWKRMIQKSLFKKSKKAKMFGRRYRIREKDPKNKKVLEMENETRSK